MDLLKPIYVWNAMFYHNIFYCKFPTYIANTITKYLDKVYNDSQPEFIFMVEPVFLYNVFFEQFSIIDYIQLTHLILVAKSMFKNCK